MYTVISNYDILIVALDFFGSLTWIFVHWGLVILNGYEDVKLQNTSKLKSRRTIEVSTKNTY